MKRKNLEKAIIMGLLATSISVPVWAADNEEVLGSQWQAGRDLTYDCDLKIEVTDADRENGKNAAIGPSANIDVGDNKLTLISDTYNAVDGGYGCNIIVNAGSVDITAGENGIKTTEGYGAITFSNIKTNFKIVSGGQGIDNKTGSVTIQGSTTSSIDIHSNGTGGLDSDQAGVNNSSYKGEVLIEGGSIKISADKGSGIKQSGNSSTIIEANDKVTIAANHSSTDVAGIKSTNGNVNITANNDIEITSNKYGINTTSKGQVNLNGKNNTIKSDTYGVNAENNAQVKIIGKNNIIEAAKDEEGYGSSYAIKVDTKSNNWFKYNGADTVLNAIDGNNKLYGAIYAKGDGSSVLLDHFTGSNENRVNANGSNYIYSSAHGTENEHVVAAVYAKDNATIDIKAGENGENYIATDFKFQTGDEHDKDSERTIWAQQGGKINIEGQTTIVNSNPNANTGGTPGNSYGIAVTAGTGDTDFDSITDFNIEDDERSTVKINYLDGTGKDGNTVKSSITGDIVSGYGGLINIQAFDSLNKANSTSGIIVNGNALAANGGKLNMDIGNGGVWTGRADDYGDAGVVKDGEHTIFFNPAFSNEIVQGGQVNLTMGEGSRWNVTGQSWITSINTGNSDIAAGTPIIDLVNANTNRNETAHALTIYNLNGNAIFNMSLDGDRDVSDMLYIKNAEGEYVINVVDSVSVDDMYQDGFDGLRFATIGDGSNVSFRAITYNQGINNVEYEVGQDVYDKENSEENDAYNSSKGDGEMSSDKPGSDRVEDFFDSTGTPENPQGPDDTEIMTLENTVESDSNVNGTTNFKLIDVKNSEISDGGKTVVNMSKVNYSNAVYMDRLNKRLGEARYINTEEDQGMWVRMRHDRIGKDNEFRIMNTMYELGYDEKQECDNGERRVGAAIDYMDGSSEYTGVGGSGDVSRKGIWLYDTWLGDKGHYSDFVAKWGHLSNDFTLYRGGEKITGDFSNNVYSISAEYGRKKDIGNNWYFEPQVQLQYARVTDANYTTSQGTEVSLDAINSLIARAGFRLGKDLGERSTVYFKADVLHEFLGDQDIYAHDKTGTMDVTYGNEGTWCDIGFGFATAMSKTSYAYLDVETSLGNDYEETYQINAGLQWSF